MERDLKGEKASRDDHFIFHGLCLCCPHRVHHSPNLSFAAENQLLPQMLGEQRQRSHLVQPLPAPPEVLQRVQGQAAALVLAAQVQHHAAPLLEGVDLVEGDEGLGAPGARQHLPSVLVHHVEVGVVLGLPADPIIDGFPTELGGDDLQQVQLEGLLDENDVVFSHPKAVVVGWLCPVPGRDGAQNFGSLQGVPVA